MRDRYGAPSERSWKLRFHAQTAGCSLTWQQPYNNVVRTALQALAAVLGGAQSLHTNSLDEAYALPSEHAVTIALRTQQVLAYESGVTSAPDPLGGSYFLEKLTLDMESGGERLHPAHRRNGRHDPGDRGGIPADRDRRGQLPLPAGGRERRAGDRRASTGSSRDDQPIELLQIDEKRSGNTRRRSWRRSRSGGDHGKVTRTLDALQARRRGHGEHDAAHPRRGARLRDAGRDLRRVPRRLRHVPGSRLRL